MQLFIFVIRKDEINGYKQTIIVQYCFKKFEEDTCIYSELSQCYRTIQSKNHNENTNYRLYWLCVYASISRELLVHPGPVVSHVSIHTKLIRQGTFIPPM